METSSDCSTPKILILATTSGGYAGADAVGQLHTDYPNNTYILPVLCPSMFNEDFYLRIFNRGIDGVIVMYSGTDSPYKGGPERAAELINKTYPKMKELGIDTRRLKLTAICTVCTKPFLKEVNQMNTLLREIGFVEDEMAVFSGKEAVVA